MALNYNRDYKTVLRRRKIFTILAIVIVFLAASFGVLYLRQRNHTVAPQATTEGGKEPGKTTAEVVKDTEETTTEPGGEGMAYHGREITRTSIHLYSIGIPHINPTDVNREYVKVDKRVEDSYFDDALFIGDSRTEGFVLYSSLSNIHAYCSKGLSITKIYEDPIVDMGEGRMVTVMQALEEQKFGKIYIMFGVNELGWPYDDLFYDQYSKVVEDIKKLQPDAIIYVENIIPISAERSAKDEIYNKENVDRFNALIDKMCKERNVILLDVHGALADKDGNLPADASTDGVHCNVDYCDKWMDYLRNNTYKLK